MAKDVWLFAGKCLAIFGERLKQKSVGRKVSRQMMITTKT
jgi:hypothetical protein